ncbi:MAG TPA: FxsA family protein [Tabrizicola sp.]|nr:FxsA family protein [Tabrizicola sp.]
MLFLLGLLALVLVEIVLLIKLGGAIGIWLTLGWIIFAIFFGIILLRGIAMLGSNAIDYRLDAFSDRNNPMAHRGLVMIAGLLFIIPGPLGDVVGFLLLFPPIRRLIIGRVAARISRRAGASSSVVIDAEWTDVSQSAADRDAGPKDQKP